MKLLKSIRQRVVKLVPTGSSDSIKHFMDTMGIDFEHYCFDLQIALNEFNKRDLYDIGFTYYDLLQGTEDMKIFDSLIKIPLQIVESILTSEPLCKHRTEIILLFQNIYSDIANIVSAEISLHKYPYASSVFFKHSKFDKDDIVAYTEINGCKYFATVNQIESADAYIIDPNGLNQLLKNMPTEKFTIIYISPKDEELHKNAAMERGDSKKDFKKRVISEDDEFTKFENDLDTYTYMYNNNIYDCIRFINDYTPDVIEYFAYTLNKIKEYSKYVFTK